MLALLGACAPCAPCAESTEVQFVRWGDNYYFNSGIAARMTFLSRAGEPANFFSGSGSSFFFFQAAPAPRFFLAAPASHFFL